MRTCLLILLLAARAAVAGPDSLTAADLAPHATAFRIEQGRLVGPGADTLLRLAAESRFLLLGEYHGSADIGELTAALLPPLAGMGYRHFGLEVGPSSAARLEALAGEDDPRAALVAFFLGQFRATGHAPIPFFEGEEDLVFLLTAARHGYALWGLDQEYLGGFGFLLEELHAAAGSPSAEGPALAAARERLLGHYAANAADPDDEVYDRLLADTATRTLLDRYAAAGPDAARRVADWWATCRIYHDWKHDRLANLAGRTALQKRAFAERWAAASADGDPGRVLLKMGGMHLQKGWTGNACYELGNLVQELAVLRGERATHLGFAVRHYVDDDGSVGDNVGFPSPWVREMTPLLAQGRTDAWVLVNLRAARRAWINERKVPGRALAERIRGYDYVLIPPPARDVVPLAR